MLEYINWTVTPEIFEGLPVRWYGLLFASGFLIGHYIMTKILVQEGKPEKDMDSLTVFMVVGTVLGARLGHCLFYQPEYYLPNPLEIFKIWEGGLASHGAAIGILASLYFYSKSKPDQPYLWIVDRIVIVVALAGALIRIGNLMNSEIYGKPTDLPWGFRFILPDGPNAVPRHPTQIYEAVWYFISFWILKHLYDKMKEKTPHGYLLGWFLIFIFGMRIFFEFFKEQQVESESITLSMIGLNFGQLLSIPFTILGLWLMLRGHSQAKQILQAN
ncbi:MAG: prolipoprotein diacylglyceryl transferase [Bacteroidia bacterium]|nr:prolipoprotein diacylglyceryl transferase [Bacteroidia bacterium]